MRGWFVACVRQEHRHRKGISALRNISPQFCIWNAALRVVCVPARPLASSAGWLQLADTRPEKTAGQRFLREWRGFHVAFRTQQDSQLQLRFPAPPQWAYTSGMAAAFDTLSAAKELQAAGFEQTQAEAVAKIVRAGQGNLATKDDLAGVHTQMGAMGKEIGALRAELGAIKWVLGLVAALNVAILVRLLLD